VPLGNVLVSLTGSWHAVFLASCAMDVVAAIAALVILKPMRMKSIEV